MKYLFIFILFAVIRVLGRCEINTDKFVIQVNIQSNVVTKIYLAKYYGERIKTTDSTITDNNGIAHFTLSDKSNTGIYKVFSDPKQSFNFIFNKENISFSTAENHLSDSLKVIESVENKLYFTYLKNTESIKSKMSMLFPLLAEYPKEEKIYSVIEKEYGNLQKKEEELFNELKKNHSGSYAFRYISATKSPVLNPGMSEAESIEHLKKHFFDYLDFTDEELLNSDAIPSKIVAYLSLYRGNKPSQKQLEAEFIKAVDVILNKAINKKDKVYNFILNYLIEGLEKYKLNDVLTHITTNYSSQTCENTEKKSTLERRIKSYKKLAIGQYVTDINIKSINGTDVQLSKINSDYTLIVFWASWCPHCLQTLPELSKIYNKQQSKKWEVLAISIDTNYVSFSDAIKKSDYKWVNSCDTLSWNSKIAEDYSLYATPTMFLINKNLEIIAKPITIDELKSDLEKEGLVK